MSPVAIPLFNAHGVLPPYNSGSSVASAGRSPYSVGLKDLIARYANSRDRISVLQGFLDFRVALHGVNLVKGFQWVNGSFIEDIELIENRAPRDIDIVTFFYLPTGVNQHQMLTSCPTLFDRHRTKADFHVDAYFVSLEDLLPEQLVERGAYWYSIFSHRRNGIWRGYLELELTPTEDADARSILTGLSCAGVQQ